MYKLFSADPYIKLKSITKNEFNRNGLQSVFKYKITPLA